MPPEQLPKNVKQYKSLLSTTDLAKPLWSTEGGWAQNSTVTDPDIQASWVARYYLLGWSSGVAEMYWFAYDSPTYGSLWTSGGGLNKAGTAYGQTYNWIVGSSLTTPCSVSGTVWTCGLTLADGTASSGRLGHLPDLLERQLHHQQPERPRGLDELPGPNRKE